MADNMDLEGDTAVVLYGFQLYISGGWLLAVAAAGKRDVMDAEKAGPLKAGSTSVIYSRYLMMVVMVFNRRQRYCPSGWGSL